MESLLYELAEEIQDAVKNNVPQDELIDWVNSQGITDQELDLVVGLLEDRGCEEFAEELANEIHTPTLDSEVQSSQPWYKNERCNRAAADEPEVKYEKPWAHRFPFVRKDDTVEHVPYPHKPLVWRTDI